MAFGVGEFANPGKTVIYRMPTNPMDRSTIVSILPKLITEYKPTLFPGKFVIPPAKDGDFEVFIVEPSSWFLPNLNDRLPPTEVPVNSVELAKSIVQDYCNGVFMCNMSDQMPGLFYIPGEWTKSNIVKYTDTTGKTFDVLLSEARQKQRNWFVKLVESADSLWSRSNGNPLAISDDSRLAAQNLQLKDKPWMQDFTTVSKINCKFCGALVDPKYPVCGSCHAIIDPKRAKELDIAFAVK